MTANFLIHINRSLVESLVEEEEELSVYGGEFGIWPHLEEIKESFNEGCKVSDLDMHLRLKFLWPRRLQSCDFRLERVEELDCTEAYVDAVVVACTYNAVLFGLDRPL